MLSKESRQTFGHLNMSTPRKKRVLCLEDDIDTCRLIARVLSGYEIVPATTMSEAWELYNEQSFSLLVVDYRLTDGNGVEFCDRVRRLDFMTPVIFISGDPSLTEAEVRMAGGQRLLRKGSSTFIDDLYANVQMLAVINS